MPNETLHLSIADGYVPFDGTYLEPYTANPVKCVWCRCTHAAEDINASGRCLGCEHKRQTTAVNKAQGAHYQTNKAQGAKPTTLQALFEAMRANDPSLPEWHDLPTFGGPDIENTTGVWSWDATHYIEGTCADDLQLVARDEGGEV